MGARFTLLLLAAVVATAYFLWSDNREPTSVLVSDQVVPLLAFDESKIDSIAISYRDRNGTFQRNAGTWNAPPGSDVSELIRQIRELKEILVIDATRNEWPDFGLEPAAGRIELRSGEEIVVALRIGNRNPAATGVYVLREEDGRAFLTGAAILWPLEALLTKVE